MNKDLIKKTGFILASALLLLIVLYWAAAAVFMRMFELPAELARPWTMIQYWSMYRNTDHKWVRLAVNLCFWFPVLAILVSGFLVLANKNKKALHGAARFANLSEVRKSGLIDPPGGTDKTVLVGKYKNQYLTYGGFQFVLLAAPTRSGKGVGVVVPNCLNYSDSLVVLDIKGENFDITSGYRKSCGQEVYLFSPYDEEGKTHRYNPLEYISEDPSERLGDIDAIGQALYTGSESDKFWSENAKDFFRGVTLFVLETPELPKTLGEILRQASGKGKPVKEHLLGKLQEAQANGRPYSSPCVDSLNRVLSNSDNTLAGIVATFNTALLSFQNPKVDLATSANDFDLRDVRRKRMSIYFKIEPTKLKDAKVVINLFFDQLLNLNTRKLPSQDNNLKYQCLVLLDEMTSIGTVNMIKQAVSYMAGYNMRLLTIIQNKSQLEDVYGKAGAVTLLSNHALMIMYAPSPATQTDANEYSEMLGYETVKSKSKSTGKGGGSTSESDQRRALMLPQEIRELGKDNEIVTLENCKPVFCQKIKYYQDKNFMQRANWKTPDIPVQDVKLFVAQLEQRIRPARSGELNQEKAAESIVTGDTTLPPDMRDSNADEWTEERVNCYIDNLVTESICTKTISNYNALKEINSKTIAEKSGILEQMNQQVSASAASGENQTNAFLNAIGANDEDESNEDDESDETAEMLSVMRANSAVNEEASEESIHIRAAVEEQTVETIEAPEDESDEDESENDDEAIGGALPLNELNKNRERVVTANVTAKINAPWNKQESAEFVANLISQIKQQLVEKPGSQTSVQSLSPTEPQNQPLAETASETEKTDIQEEKTTFKNIQKIRKSYRNAVRKPLAFQQLKH